MFTLENIYTLVTIKGIIWLLYNVMLSVGPGKMIEVFFYNENRVDA